MMVSCLLIYQWYVKRELNQTATHDKEIAIHSSHSPKLLSDRLTDYIEETFYLGAFCTIL